MDLFNIENSKLDYEELRKKKIKILEKEEYIIELLKKYNIKLDDIKNISLLEEYLLSEKKCQVCKTLDSCPNVIKGQKLSLEYNCLLYPTKEYCKYYLDKKLNEKYLDNIIYSNIPDNLKNISLNEIKPIMENDDSKKLYVKLQMLSDGSLNKGLFICGTFGTGKTYMSIAFINQMAKKGYKCAFIKTNDFINHMRKININDPNMYDHIIENIKKVPYIVFDDIGTESVSSYGRDDLLFNILDYRMENKLITVFTSNHSMETLKLAFTYDKNQNKDTLKAERLIERIRILSSEFYLGGINLRK